MTWRKMVEEEIKKAVLGKKHAIKKTKQHCNVFEISRNLT